MIECIVKSNLIFEKLILEEVYVRKYEEIKRYLMEFLKIYFKTILYWTISLDCTNY